MSRDHEQHEECDSITKVLREIARDFKDLLKIFKPAQRFIRLQIVEVRFVESQTTGNHMADNIGIDVPAGKIARLVLKPVDQKGLATKLDGPITAVVQGDPATAQVAVGPDGLTVDIMLPEVVDSQATVELDGDADVDPANVEVITTLVTLRKLGEVPGKAVTLGAAPANITFPGTDQFGVFPAASAKK